jgi:tRNA1Val (adenine37-N6)-methyltransferase
MKVGTDGVLLGAWCPLGVDEATRQGKYKILDIGTGSGLIALMLAQRATSIDDTPIVIDTIDIDAGAAEQAKFNFEQSPWSKLLRIYQSSLQEWQSEEEYDLIVSNPPYFQSSLKNPDAQRATARHTDSLSYSELIKHSGRLLKNNGMLALVLPIEAEEDILSLAAAAGLLPTHITYVHTKPGKPAKRILIALRKSDANGNVESKHFYIESEDSPRSEEYRKLTEEFYL